MNEWHKQAFYRVSVKALIRNDKNEILMVSEYEASNFSLPGGGLNYGETPHECLKRELYEEIGLTSEFTEELRHVQTKRRETKGGWWLMWVTYDIHYKELKYGKGVDANSVRWVPETEVDESTVAGDLIRQVLEAKGRHDTI